MTTQQYETTRPAGTTAGRRTTVDKQSTVTPDRSTIMAAIPTTTQPASTSSLKQVIARHPLIAFFVLAFAISWLLVFPLALSRNVGVGILPYDLPDPIVSALYLAASFIGPSLAAVIVLAMTEGRAGVKHLLKRCVQWRVKPRWYLVVLGTNLMIWLLSYSVLMGPEMLTATIRHWPLLFTTYLPYVAFGILIPSIAEEPGWRGFALPRLQRRYGPLTASLILGLLHGLWHLPAMMSLLGPLPLVQYAPFLLTAMMTTVLYTWVYNAPVAVSSWRCSFMGPGTRPEPGSSPYSAMRACRSRRLVWRASFPPPPGST